MLKWQILWWSIVIGLGILCFTIKPVLQWTIGG